VAVRKYRLKKRAERLGETRQRIVDAAMALHEEVGPLRTTVSAVAERAGVERLTVYRHFPNPDDMFAACSTEWTSQHPPPQPGAWQAETDPARRARMALLACYRYYRENEPMLDKIMRDAPLLPALEAQLEAGWAPYLRGLAADLAGGFEGAHRLRLAAAEVALEFGTWQALARRGLSDEQAADLMATLVCCAPAPAGAQCAAAR
jgi:AcrR family transcriptional regulator